MAGIEIATGEHVQEKHEESPKASFKRRFLWWATSTILLGVLYFAFFNNVVWCQNVLKFVVWVNFIIWLIVMLSSKTRKDFRKTTTAPTSSTANALMSLPFIIIFAAFGWFGYAAMKFTSLIMQQAFYFGDNDD